MEGLKARLAEEEIGASFESFEKCLISQKYLFHSQVDQLQRVVATQCQLTGVNPLSQEMVAEALGISIGKKPRDLLNPKAVDYMLSVFAIKDKPSKKETREISGQFGITLAQVRDFFASQRIRVRDVVQSSQEIYRDRTKVCKLENGSSESTDVVIGTDPVPLLTMGPITSDTIMSNVVEPTTHKASPQKEMTCQNNSQPSGTEASPIHCDSPEFSLETCIPIDDVPEPSAPLKSTLPINVVPVPLNIVPPDCSGSVVSNMVSVSNAGYMAMLPCSMVQEETLPGLDNSEKHFVENVFNFMSKENTFSGQVKLMERILKIENPTVLDWFLSKGGVMILASWLGQAAMEEQTSVLLVILKVLCHLPLEKAVPEHMSVILQSVNSLRFYRTQDLSNKARVLLARWSKLFARSQPMRKNNSVKSQCETVKQTLLIQSINEILSDESRQSGLENTDGNLTSSNQALGNIRKRERPQPTKLLTASSDESSRKNTIALTASQGKGRRKVQLVEHPSQISTGRSLQTARASVSQNRPLSTDDIQKAKLRKEYMEAKYGKPKVEPEPCKQGLSKSKYLPPAAQASACPEPRENKNNRLPTTKATIKHNQPVMLHPCDMHEKKQQPLPLRKTDELKQQIVSHQNSADEQPQLTLHPSCRTGEQSATCLPKSAVEQTQPMVPVSCNSLEPIPYSANFAEQTQQIVPPSSSVVQPLVYANSSLEQQQQPVLSILKSLVKTQVRAQKKTILESKEPFWKQCKRVQITWKTPPEMAIDKEWRVGTGESSRELNHQKARNNREKEFVFQKPEGIPSNPKSPWENEMDYDDTLTPIIPMEQALDTTVTSPAESLTPSAGPTTHGTGTGFQHDPVLLNALLKNPELVFSLTSGQGNITNEDTVRLLDMIKATGGTLPSSSLTNGFATGTRVAKEHIEGSLPSPTPSSNLGTSGWQPEVARNGFSRHSPTPSSGNCVYPGVAAPAYDRHPPASFTHTQLLAANNFQQLHLATPQFGVHNNNSSFISPGLHSPTPHADTFSSVKPFHHSASVEPNIFENRSPVACNPSRAYSSQPPAQAHQPAAYDHLSCLVQQPSFPSSGLQQTQQQPVFDHNPQNPAYAYSGQYGNQYGYSGSFSDSRRSSGLTPNSYSQLNSSHYGSTDWQKNVNVTLNQYESWSPSSGGGSNVSVDYDVSGPVQPATVYASNYRSDPSRPVKFLSGYPNGWRDERRR